MEFNTIKFKKENQIGIITINRPDKLNALNSESFDDLNRVIDFIKEKDEILVVVITGSGEKAFVAGADIKELNKCDADTGKDFSRKGQIVFDKIEQLRETCYCCYKWFCFRGRL